MSHSTSDRSVDTLLAFLLLAAISALAGMLYMANTTERFRSRRNKPVITQTIETETVEEIEDEVE